jgi:feruloyl-CoA synthase
MQRQALAALAPSVRLFARPDIQAHWKPDGSLVLRSRAELGSLARSTGVWLEHWGGLAPDRPMLAERLAEGGIRQITYGQALASARAIGQSLLDRRLDRTRPILILADNGIDHALVMLGALHVGQAIAPVSTAYARLSRDYGKLRLIAELIEPRLVYVDDASAHARALAALDLARAEIVASRGTLDGRAITPLTDLLKASPGPALAAAHAAVGPSTVAKVLFTSGSTGIPKGVVNTQAMLTASQQSLARIWPFVERDPPRLVDWLPWNHTFGGNHNFNLVLRNGGFMLIDDGKPVPGLVERTVSNLKQASPTIYFNVPRGYAMLLDRLEQDEALQTSFFDQLQLIFYSGAALPPALWSRLRDLSRRVTGSEVAMTTSWGATETSPLATSAHFHLDGPGNLGLPVPGTEIRLAPVDGRLEIRCRGPNITPGYYRAPEATAAAFDADGWLRTGDAVRLADPMAPEKGILFDGRITESFKLSSGTWVNVGLVRTALVSALAPLVEDAVITGHDRDEAGALLFPSLGALRALAGRPDADLTELSTSPAVHEAVGRALGAYNRDAGGSSQRIARVLLLTEPASMDAGEITDKGYINQRAVLQRCQAHVAALHESSAAEAAIVPVDA